MPLKILQDLKDAWFRQVFAMKHDEENSDYIWISKTVFALIILVFIPILILVSEYIVLMLGNTKTTGNVSLCYQLTALHMKMKYFSLIQNVELEHLKNKILIKIHV